MSKKKVVLGILLDLVFLIVFNTIFFVLGGTSHSVTAWISYGFIHFSYLMVILTPILIRESSEASLFGMTICGISSVYFIFEFVVGVVFILINPKTIKASLCIQVIIAGIYLAILLINLIANEATADNVQKQQEEVAFIKNVSSRVKVLMDKVDDKKAKEQMYDLLHSSPSKSSVSVQALENDVQNKIGELENAVLADDKNTIIKIAKEVITLMEERNRKVRVGR